MIMPIRLDIGCGVLPRLDFTGIDAYVEGDSITHAQMWDLPYGDNTVAEIYTSHALEHIPKRAVIPTLKEFYRVLQPGGLLTILVPDLEWCCRAWLEHQSNDWFLDVLFGNQEHPGEFHMTGYTVRFMVNYLAAAGFSGDCKYGATNSHDQKTLVFQIVKQAAE